MFYIHQSVWSHIFGVGVVTEVAQYPFCKCVTVMFGDNKQIFNSNGVWMCPDEYDMEYLHARDIHPC